MGRRNKVSSLAVIGDEEGEEDKKKNTSRRETRNNGEQDPNLQGQRGQQIRSAMSTSWQADDDLIVGFTLTEGSASTTATKPKRGLHWP
jgi:hypothetical protein